MLQVDKPNEYSSVVSSLAGGKCECTGYFSCSGVPTTNAFQLSLWNRSGAVTGAPATGRSWLLEEKSSLKICSEHFAEVVG